MANLKLRNPLADLKIHKGPKLKLKHNIPPELPLTVAEGMPMGLDLRDMKDGTHLTCGDPNCNSPYFAIIKLNNVVCVGCQKCAWESYIHFPESVVRNLIKL